MRRRALRSTHFVLSKSNANPAIPEPMLWTAVSKRLIKRAVDRNGLRRVAREAWRSLPGGTVTGHQLLRLTRRPAAFDTMSRAQRKRFWRSEIDALFRQIRAAGHGRE